MRDDDPDHCPFGKHEWLAHEFVYYDDGKDRGEDWRKPKAARSEHPGVPSNLLNYRFIGDAYDGGAEADDIRAMRTGDKRAGDRLVKHFQPLLGERVSHRWGPSKEELIAIAQTGLFNGLRNYNLENGSRLGTYLRLKIDGAILDGIRGTTNADRKLLAYPNATLGELVRLSGYSTKSEVKRGNAYRKCEEAILKRDGERDKIPYSTIESTPDDDTDGGGKPTEIVLCGHIDDLEGKRFHTHRDQGALIDFYAAEQGRREQQRLKEIGRPSYASELVARNRARIEALSDPEQYLYPWCRTGTA